MDVIKGFLRDVRGNAGMMFAAAAVPLMLSAGVAIDMIRMGQARAVLQSAADAAAIAGGTSGDMTDAEMDKIVRDYMIANGAEAVLTQVTAMRQWKDTNNATFNVSIEGGLNTSLMKLAGITSMELEISSQVNLGQQSLELALVLDNTGSMAGTKIEALKTSAKELVNIINESKSDYSTLKVAVVPFSEYVNVGPAQAAAPWMEFAAPIAGWEGCVGSRDNPHDEQEGFSSGQRHPGIAPVNCVVPLLPLTSDISAIVSKIDSMGSEGNTYIPGGLLWGWNVLSSDAPFSEGMTNAQLAAKNGRKVIVLMTDGANTISPTYPSHEVGNTALSDTKLTTICDNVKAENYAIYTVSFMVDDVNIQTLLTNCASEPGMAFDADNSTELYAAFKDIGQQLAAIRITQ
jgi:Flp pilus assembly protein TadG